jgi:pilus assembly protein CpaB
LNPRQRRGVLLLVIAGIGAIVVFALVAGYVSDVRKEVDPKTSILVLNRDVPALQPIPQSALSAKDVPEKYASKRAIRDRVAIGDRVPGAALPAGSELEDGMLVEPPQLKKGQQEVSILISADTGVAGKIRPGDRVDVNATFAGDNRSVPSARKIITNAQIVTIGTPQLQGPKAFSNDANNNGAQAAAEQVVPVTFALTPRNVLKLTYAETNAAEIRLSLIRPDDPNVIPPANRSYVLPPTAERPPQ